MKKLSIVAVIALAVMLTSSPSFAQVNFFVEADLPSASSATFTVSKVFVGPPLNFVPTPTFNLDFGTLALNTTLGIFLPSPAFYWVIDVGSNGAGMPDLAVSYTDTANPNGALNNGSGLGGHANINFAEIVTNEDLTQTTNDIITVALGDVDTLSGGGIDETEYADGFLRTSVGLATGDPLVTTTAVPFTASDQPGSYLGTLTLTATFD